MTTDTSATSIILRDAARILASDTPPAERSSADSFRVALHAFVESNRERRDGALERMALPGLSWGDLESYAEAKSSLECLDTLARYLLSVENPKNALTANEALCALDEIVDDATSEAFRTSTSDFSNAINRQIALTWRKAWRTTYGMNWRNSFAAAVGASKEGDAD